MGVAWSLSGDGLLRVSAGLCFYLSKSGFGVVGALRNVIVVCIVTQGGGKSRLHNAEPGFDDAEWLLQSFVQEFVEHGLVCWGEVIDAAVELPDERFDASSANGFVFGECNTVKCRVADFPEGMKSSPDVLSDLGGPGRAGEKATIEVFIGDV